MRRRDAMGRRIHRLAPSEDVERELRTHIDLRASELVAAGWEPEAARAEAMRVFGDLDAIRGECRVVAERHARSTRHMRMWGELRQDLRYAWRGLLKEPLFALLGIVTLALGIGANSATFGIVNGVLLTPLPYEDPSRLVALWELSEAGNDEHVTWPNFRDLQASTRTLSGMSAYQAAYPKMVLGGAEPVRAQFARVSATFFAVLGVAPALGRTFSADEVIAGGATLIVVSDRFWRRHLNSVRDLSSARLHIDGVPVQVAGVMPPGFDQPHGTDVWWPLDVDEAAGLGSRSAHNFQVLARLAPGATRAQSQRELTQLAQQIRARDAESDAAGIAVYGLLEDTVGSARRALFILLGASAFVLLVACSNLASALLARATRRSNELAVRAALGAHRLRLVRQLLTESLLLAVCGAIAGLGLAYVLVRAVITIGPDAVPRLDQVRLDGWVLAFTTLLSVATALTFGTAPALRATMTQPYEVLRGGGRGTDSAPQRRAWSLLIGTEVALALLLLIGSGLLIRSFYNLTRVDAGVEIGGVIAADIVLPRGTYEAPEARVRIYNELLTRVRSQPGVERASVSMTVPLGGFDPSGAFEIEHVEGDAGSAAYRVVSPDFFETMRIPILRGRGFTPADHAGTQPVGVIDAELERRYFHGIDPIGRRFRTGGMDGDGETWVTIVGVASPVRQRALEEAPRAAYYLPYTQRPNRMMGATLLVRGAGREEALLQPLRATIRQLDQDIGVELSTMQSRVGASLQERRFTLFVLCVFAGIALLLAAIGIYGVVASAVAQRTREIGIRVALGAAAPRVLWAVAAGALGAVAAGIVAGLAGAVVLSRFAAFLLYEIEPFDVPTYALVVLLLFTAACVALLVPASRAARVTPMRALRDD